MANFSAFNGLRDTTFDVSKDIQEPKGTFAKVSKQVLSQKNPNNVSVKQVAEAFGGIVKQGPKVTAETFAPAITEFFKTTGGILGEGLAYAVDLKVRRQFKAGNLDILPTVSSTTQLDLAKKTIAAGIEIAVYRNIPSAIRGNLATRGGIGALQGIGFAVAEGLAKDKSVKEIIDSAKALGPTGAGINLIAPYLAPILKAEMKLVPKEIKLALKGLKFEAKGVPLETVQANMKALRQVDELFPLGAKKAKATKIVAETPELQKFVDKKSALLRKTKDIPMGGEVKEIKVPNKEPVNVPLAKEAQKFKTAEEFVDAQPRVFHGGRGEISKFDARKLTSGGEIGRGIYFSGNKEKAKLYGVAITELKIDLKNPLVITKKELWSNGGLIDKFNENPNYTKKLIEQGYDGVIVKEGNIIDQGVVFPSSLDKIKTKSQLTDFFNKVKGEKPTKIVEKAPVLKVETKEGVSKHFERIKSDLRAVNDSVAFEKINLKDQAKQAFEFAEKSPEEALQVAYGLKNPPGTLTRESLQISIIESLKSAGKYDMSRAIARRMSLNFTKSAQILNVAKLDLGSAGARKIESIIMDVRLKKIGKNIPSTVKDITPRQRALNKISKDSKVVSKEIQKSTRSIYKTADDLLDALTC